mmetsp:Transcript_6091/g.17284  ORF Transcript_6091/g.17284 Transcript_6091/m.17284 type:complete len:326 (+) Transcript_6091:154-1131(+)
MSSSTELLDEYYALLAEAGTGTDAGNGNGFRPLDTATISWNGSGSGSEETEKAISSSDTLVVVDMQHDFLPGGAFGVDEGDATIEGICDLIQKFHKAGATVIATRDYHPKEHCSFTTHGGPFPPHCIMGTHGSLLHPRIAETLQPLLQLANDDTGGGGDDDDDSTNRNTHVVYKGFFAGVESFGGFPYDTSNDEWKDRLSHVSEEAIEWSGAWALQASAIGSDANAPPDVMSLLKKKPCLDLLPKESDGRVFCCGLALDYCVLDTAVNFVQQTTSGPGACFVVKDLTRAARVPGLGCFGSGFLTDPNVLMEKLANNKIRMAQFVE